MSEGHVKSACIQLLNLWGCDAISNTSGGVKTDKGYFIRFGKKGSGDILALAPGGKWVEVECKFGKNNLQSEQKLRKILVENLGGIYIVAHSIEDLEKRKSDILTNQRSDYA